MPFLNRFVGFLKEYRIISLSVAFIIGIVAFNFVQSFINDIILPLIKPLFPSRFAVWEDITLPIGAANIRIGSFLSAFFSLLLVVLLLYVLVEKTLHWKPKKR